MQLAQHQLADHVHAGVAVVEAGNSGELPAAMMLEYLGWTEASTLILDAFAKTIQKKTVTYDLERLMTGAKKVKTSEFASHIIENF